MIKWHLHIILFIIGLSGHCQDTTILSLKGQFINDTIYIQNPSIEDGGFTTVRVFVNNIDCAFDNASAYIITPANLGLKKGDALTIDIHHHTSKKPRVLAASRSFITPPSMLEIDGIKQTGKSLELTITNAQLDSVDLLQYRWNNWVHIARLPVDNDKFYCAFDSLNIGELHTGINQFRLRATIGEKLIMSNKIFSQGSYRTPVKYQLYKTEGLIAFNRITSFQIFNTNGKLLFQGKSQMVNIPRDGNGEILKHLFLNYDNKNVTLKL